MLLFIAEEYSIVYMLHTFLILSICQWTSRLLPCPSYCKPCCDEHWSERETFLGWGKWREEL